MGWVYAIREPDVSDEQLFGETMHPHTVEALHNDRGEHVVYLAVHFAHGELQGKVLGIVCLYDHRQEKFGIKVMDEGMGPCARRCPPHILNRLSPVEELFPLGSFGHVHAAIWRAECRQSFGA